MYKYLLTDPTGLHVTYKDFVKWCNDRLEDNL